MVRQHSDQQLIKEARQIAKDHNMRVAECKTAKGTDYVVYRRLLDGRDSRLGKRSTAKALRQFVAKCAGFH